ncbi:MAG: hypothetical protein PVI04_06840, partial [Anaerolineales bacterium]
MKRYHWLGAAVLLLLLVSFTSPDLSPSSLIQRPDLLLAILGIGLWVFYLRSFNRLRLRQIQSKRVVALNASALGFELAGFVALLQLQLASVRGVHSTLAVITIGIAIALQLASWAFDLASDESAVNSNVADGPQTGAFRDYLMLTKPIVLALLLVTTLAAMIV